ncbi:hypothetical protein [Streptosporangium minutum]|uniref:Uncharacterized protein n=1 Tax=Streptosporangium minutum TaxID=569862 RepID=A0A243RI47_9ACTN|nr:hypothetical protein [Streptosporangium minutum]OUC94441.1 hypothetical protein CA984_22265 [Streptosporangium minutum]
MVDQPLPHLSVQQQAVAFLADEPSRAEVAQQGGERWCVDCAKQSLGAQGAVGVGRGDAAVLRDEGQKLLRRRRQVQSRPLGRFVPALQKYFDGRDGLDKLGTEFIGRVNGGGRFGFADVEPQRGGQPQNP